MLKCHKCGKEWDPKEIGSNACVTDRGDITVLIDFLVNGCVALDPFLPRFSMN